MEFIVLLIAIGLIAHYVQLLTNTASANSSKNTTSLKKHDDHVQKMETSKTIVHVEPIETFQREEQRSSVTNNYYIQNNVYVHQNHYKSKSSTEESKDHSKSVWQKLGYRVKSGETYAYKMYGREIFTPEQVTKIGYKHDEPLALECGLTRNQEKVKQLGYALVNKYHSKRIAKDILVENYGLDENTAKYAAGYRGYDDW